MQLQSIQQKIYEIRGLKVMLDYDLAELYETETKRLKEAVRRNIDRFPEDFMFEITPEEYASLRSQIATLKEGRGHHRKYLPFAFTEQGVSMLSSVLNSMKAIRMNIAIMRTFVFMRQYALTHKELTDKIIELEKKYDLQFTDIFEAIKYLMYEKQVKDDWKSRNKIGFKK
jgi:hypothetical protein